MRRLLICLAAGVVLTLASAWLPGTLVTLGKAANLRGERVSVSAESPRKYILIANLYRRPLNTWVYLSAHDHDSIRVRLHDRDWEFTSDGPSPEDVLSRSERRMAWAPFCSALPYGAAPRYHTRFIETRGWPARALWCEYKQDHEHANRWYASRGAITLPGEHTAAPDTRMPRPRTLPCLPIWSGLAINVGFWTIIAAPLVFAPMLIRRLRRRRAGACPACGYDLTGAPGPMCPECGRTASA